MKVSARNQLRGTVQSVKYGNVMAEIVVRLGGGDEIVSAITATSARALGLEEGKAVAVIVKATEVIIGVDEG